MTPFTLKDISLLPNEVEEDIRHRCMFGLCYVTRDNAEVTPIVYTTTGRSDTAMNREWLRNNAGAGQFLNDVFPFLLRLPSRNLDGGLNKATLDDYHPYVGTLREACYLSIIYIKKDTAPGDYITAGLTDTRDNRRAIRENHGDIQFLNDFFK